jgi:hypothetical protein
MTNTGYRRLVGVDGGDRSWLAYCDECPPWREIRATRAAALRAGADHVARCHDQQKLAARFRERATHAESAE